MQLPSKFKRTSAHTLGLKTVPRIALALALPLLCCVAPAFAGVITGTITNGTNNKPSAGDTIAAINMAQSMDEIAHATSNASGVFHIDVPDDGQILLHVTHRGADYFKSVNPGTKSTDIEVYDSAAKIAGITGEALVLRIETDSSGKILNVSENFFVQNATTPPRTEFGGNTFDFYLPANAQVTQSLASSPGGLPTNGKLTTIDAAAGHFAFVFPIRPGETRFQVTYTLPYSGNQAYSLKLSIPTGDVAVMLPKTMQFASSAPFQSISPDPNSLSYDAHQPAFAQPLDFSISGSGQLPQIPSTPQTAAQNSVGQPAPGTQATATDTRPGGGLGIPDDPEGTNDPWAKYKWWIIGGLGLVLACGAGIMLKSGPTSIGSTPVPPQPIDDITAPAGMYTPAEMAPAIHSRPTLVTQPIHGPTGSNSLLDTLKDELFALETDRLAGHLTDAEYAQHKAALDLVLRRALTRTATNSGVNS
jgi:hypothetical protein